MLRKLSFSSLIALLVCLLLAALLPLASAGLSASHAPADGRFIEADVLPSSAVSGNVLHEHDAIEGETPARHQHAHSAADHSHEFPISSDEPASTAIAYETLWQNSANAWAKSAVPPVPKRPPRHVTA